MTEAVLPFPFRFPFPFSVSPSPFTVYRTSTRPPIGCWRREMGIRYRFWGTNRSNRLVRRFYPGLLGTSFLRPFFRGPKKGSKKGGLGVVLPRISSVNFGGMSARDCCRMDLRYTMA